MSDENKKNQGEPVVTVVVEVRDSCIYLRSGSLKPGKHKLYTHADPGEVERLRAQLAERDALLVKANYVVDHARTIDKQAFGRGTQNVDPGLFRGLGNLLAQYDEALSASAEPSAPTEDDYLPEGIVEAAIHGQIISLPSAPVQRDERAEFEAAWSARIERLGIRERGNEFYRVQPNDLYRWNNVQDSWELWQARAALERKS